MIKQIILVLLVFTFTFSRVSEFTAVPIENFQTAFNELFCTCSSGICQMNSRYIKEQKKANHFDYQSQPIKNNKYGIQKIEIRNFTNKFSCQVTSKTSHIFTVNSVFFKPKNAKDIKGIVLYAHPTLFGKGSQPSQWSKQILGIAGLYVSANYLLLATDYPGFNLQDQAQPYLIYPNCNACSFFQVLQDPDFLNIVGQFENGKFLLTAGYSEGATIAIMIDKLKDTTNACQHNLQGYKLLKTSALQGPYDLTGTIKPFLLHNVDPQELWYHTLTHIETNLAKPGLGILSINAFLYFQGYKSYTLEKAIDQNFYDMTCHHNYENFCLINKTKITIKQALNSTMKSFQIAKAISFSAYLQGFNYIKYAELDIFTSSLNNLEMIIRKQVINSDEFQLALSRASIINYKPSSSLFLFSLEWDSVVSPRNYHNYLGRLPTSTARESFDNQHYLVCPLKENQIESAVDHLGGQALANIYSLAHFENP